MSPTKTPKKQLDLLQVFRGIAAILVLFYHGTGLISLNLKQVFLSNIFIFGYAGVNFFFVLSGFIIFYIHKNDIGKKNKFKDFILKRFTRIYPIYWIILIPRLLLGGEGINFLTAITSFVLIPYPRPPIVSVSWTLSYEIFFYFIFSMMILMGLKYLRPLIIIWIVFLFLQSTHLLTLPKNNFLFQFIFSEHNFEFGFGCLAAYVVTKYRVKYGMLILTLGITLFSLSSIVNVSTVNAIVTDPLLAFRTRIPMEDEYGFIYYGIPSMLILIGSAALDLSRDIKVPSPLIYIGNASYSIYLVHATAINILTLIIAKIHLEQAFQSSISQLVILAIAFLAGCIFHSYIEQPLLVIFKKRMFLAKQTSKK